MHAKQLVASNKKQRNYLVIFSNAHLFLYYGDVLDMIVLPMLVVDMNVFDYLS